MVKLFPSRFPAMIQGNRKPGYYMDGNLYKNLKFIRSLVRKDWDFVNVIDGIEGGGKSVIAQQCAYACDPSLTLDRIVFRPEQFFKAIDGAKKYQSIVFDETYNALASKRSMSQINHMIVTKLTEIRKKNLFIWMVLPSFFDLERYVGIWRSRMLIHVTADQYKRGFFNFYSYNRKKKMYITGKKFYNYNVVKPNFRGRFTKFWLVNQEEYDKKKETASKETSNSNGEKLSSYQIRKNVLAKVVDNMVHGNHGIKLMKSEIAKLVGVSETSLFRYIKMDKEMTKTEHDCLVSDKFLEIRQPTPKSHPLY